jgi:hypothetical protein
MKKNNAIKVAGIVLSFFWPNTSKTRGAKPP